MLDITGAGAQPPMRSHWKLRSGPLSYEKPRAAVRALQGKHSKWPCKRCRANTANSNASAAGQTQSQQQQNKLQGKRPSNRNLRPCPTERDVYQGY